jgi:membrane protein YqaA with SNARE-associated domain
LWLAVISFAESSFFPVPPDVLLAPMCLARRDKALLYAGICTIASVIGGLLGYWIGATLGEGLLVWMGLGEKLKGFQALYDQWGVWVILIKGLTPIPFKIVTIASGLAHFDLKVFIFAAIVTRGLRFFLVAGLLKVFGAPIQAFVEKRLVLVTSIVAVVLIAAIVAVKLL